MSKHTPGPWIIAKDRSHIYQTNHVTRDIWEIPHCDADIDLIASAPDLLAACEPVIKEAAEREDYMHDTWNPEAHIQLTLTIAEIRAIHAAIAKATGK